MLVTSMLLLDRLNILCLSDELEREKCHSSPWCLENVLLDNKKITNILSIRGLDDLNVYPQIRTSLK